METIQVQGDVSDSEARETGQLGRPIEVQPTMGPPVVFDDDKKRVVGNKDFKRVMWIILGSVAALVVGWFLWSVVAVITHPWTLS
jgi:hypothetical protein